MNLPEFAGIDISGGLQRVAGNLRLYRNLLSEFAAKYEGLSERIATCLKGGERPDAERLAHSLKGASGNLGIGALFRIAEELERAIRESDPDVERIIEDLSTVLGQQIEIIRAGLKTAVPTARIPSAAGPVDASAAAEAVREFKQLLESCDAGTPQAFANLAGILRDSVDGSQLNALRTAVESFDFEAALCKLNEITRATQKR